MVLVLFKDNLRRRWPVLLRVYIEPADNAASLW